MAKKHNKFDLSVDSPKQAQEIVSALRSLQRNAGWELLKQIFEGNISVLETAILRKISPDDGKSISESDCDRLRDKLGYLEDLLNKPNSIIETLTQKCPETDENEEDPYERVRIAKV